MTESASRTVHVVVSGRVQGVGYREWTRREAAARGLSGWVRNRRDRTVEAMIEGPREAVEAMLAAMRKGPFLARVDGIETTDAPALDPTGGFEVRETA